MRFVILYVAPLCAIYCYYTLRHRRSQQKHVEVGTAIRPLNPVEGDDALLSGVRFFGLNTNAVVLVPDMIPLERTKLMLATAQLNATSISENPRPNVSDTPILITLQVLRQQLL
jgi:hypothetical protein